MLNSMSRTVLITGGAKGIGAATAERFSIAGDIVIINYNKSVSYAEELVARLRNKGAEAIALKADISSYSEVKSMYDLIALKYGGVDVLVNNAGISNSKLLLDMTCKDWMDIIDVNLNGCFNAIRCCIENMIRKRGGSIINISSIWGITGASMEAHYSASKAGIIGLTKALSKEYAAANINVNCVAPGIIDTDMNKDLSSEEINEFISKLPMKRMGRPEEVAELIYYLASPLASYITGQVIAIDGGY